jgi:putative aldouronate transport system permease protein
MAISGIKKTKNDIIFDGVNTLFLGVVLVAVIYPLYYIVIASLSNPDLVNSGQVWLFPRDITLTGYETLFQTDIIWLGYKNTIIYTVLGTLINMVLTIPAAYALSRKDFKGRNFIMIMITITMFFSGGIIPRFLIIKNLGILNTIWCMVLPGGVAAWNLIVSRTFFQSSIPDSLLDASRMDGCGNGRFFLQIVLPLSSAIIAVMILFYAVFHWNAFFDALMFLRDESKYPLQLILRDILISAEMDASMFDNMDELVEMMKTADLLRYVVIIASSIPVLILYPFIQKYFVKGVMIGAIKG